MSNQPHIEKARCKRSKAVIFTAVVLAAIAILSLWFVKQGVFSTNALRTDSAPHKNWAQPIELPGAPNLHKVSDTLYRGAQPTEDGMQNLQNFGIKTIINLRPLHSDRDEIADANLDYEHIYMKPWHPETEEVVRFLKLVTDPNRTPVFVHCQHGADRTGTMCAIYRIVVQGWSKQDAIQEMTEGGYDFHGVWDNLIEYIQNIDINDIRAQTGLR